MNKVIALIGNQNCGKTTLFNALTGSNQHVGNFPGVTVEQKVGTIKKHTHIKIVDLPGIYSLTPYTTEEVVAIQYLINKKPSLILNIIDATNVERNLYLTMQLKELNIPVIIALNMMDEITKSGNVIDIDLFSRYLGVKVIPISAAKKAGIDLLIDEIELLLNCPIYPRKSIYDYEVSQTIDMICSMIEKNALKIDYPIYYCATKLIEGNQDIFNKLKLNNQQKKNLDVTIKKLEYKKGFDKQIVLVNARYQEIEDICSKTVLKHQKTTEQKRTEKIDQILTHQYFAIPIFIMIMFLIFYSTFYLIGPPLQNIMSKIIVFLTDQLIIFLKDKNVSSWLLSLIKEGILTGIGSILSFLPVILVLFFFLSLLEDSGYMARVAFVMDRLLKKIGLSGRSFVPMIIGFGCSVPAILSTRTLASERDRKLTIIVTPFLSCSAKLPIYSMIISAFFAKKAAFVMITIYSIGIFTTILSALLLKSTIFKGESVPFIMELPAYRMPTFQNVYMHMFEKAQDFMKKAFTTILLASILIWFLQCFNFQFQMVNNSSHSILAYFGSQIAHFFRPLGFDDWRLSTSLIAGLSAKESVVSTLSVLTNSNRYAYLFQQLQCILTPASAMSFMTFTALYMPCIAAFAAIQREFHSLWQTILVVLFQSIMAYGMAFIIYHIALLFV